MIHSQLPNKKPRTITITKKGEEFLVSLHTFHKVAVGQYATITTNNIELATNLIRSGGKLVTSYLNYSL